MIFDQLLLILWAHTLKWVEFTSELTFELAAGLNDLVHDLDSLLLGDSWSERVVSKISSNSNSG